MQQLAGYLAKIQTLLSKKHESRKIVATVLAKYNISVPESALVVRDGVLRCATSPIQKNMIFMHKEAIIADLNQQVPSLVRVIE